MQRSTRCYTLSADAAGPLASAVGDAVTVTDPLNRTTVPACSAVTGEAGLPESAADTNNHTTTFQYGANRRQEAAVHPDATRTCYGYDAACSRSTVTDELGRAITTGW